MEQIDLSKLQNGSDIRGIALPGVPGEDVDLTPETVASIAQAFIKWIAEKTEKKTDDLTVAVGFDSRLSGPAIKEITVKSICDMRVKVVDVGLASTPAMFMATSFPEFRCDGAIMITASHLPKNRNGFKFFTKNGGLDKNDIRDILTIAENLYPSLEEAANATIFSVEKGYIEHKDLMRVYSDFLKDIIKNKVGIALNKDRDKPLTGLHVVVDAGNGAGGFYATNVLKPLGADIEGSLYLDPDGNFPNHEPNPENREAMASIKKAVTDNVADLGIIFDTDVDRSAAVDSNGRDINRNAVVGLASALIAEDYPETTIVTDSITSNGLTKFLTDNLKLKHHRFKRGYRNVINEAIALNDKGIDSQLAIETSGHAAFKENFFLDDGAYLATRIIIKAALLKARGRKIEELISGLQYPVEAEEFRLKLLTDDYGAYGDKILSDINQWVLREDGIILTSPNYEGIRVEIENDKGNTWALLRKSLHDPIMPLNIESDEKGGVKVMGKILLSFLSGYEMLDVRQLESYCD